MTGKSLLGVNEPPRARRRNLESWLALCEEPRHWGGGRGKPTGVIMAMVGRQVSHRREEVVVSRQPGSCAQPTTSDGVESEAAPLA